MALPEPLEEALIDGEIGSKIGTLEGSIGATLTLAWAEYTKERPRKKYAAWEDQEDGRPYERLQVFIVGVGMRTPAALGKSNLATATALAVSARTLDVIGSGVPQAYPVFQRPRPHFLLRQKVCGDVGAVKTYFEMSGARVSPVVVDLDRDPGSVKDFLLDPGNSKLFYFTGHAAKAGSLVVSGSKDIHLTFDEFCSMLVTSNVKGVLTIVLDCCFAGIWAAKFAAAVQDQWHPLTKLQEPLSISLRLSCLPHQRSDVAAKTGQFTEAWLVELMSESNGEGDGTRSLCTCEGADLSRMASRRFDASGQWDGQTPCRAIFRVGDPEVSRSCDELAPWTWCFFKPRVPCLYFWLSGLGQGTEYTCGAHAGVYCQGDELQDGRPCFICKPKSRIISFVAGAWCLSDTQGNHREWSLNGDVGILQSVWNEYAVVV